MKKRSLTQITISLVLAGFILASCGGPNAQRKRRAQQVRPYPTLEIQPRSITLSSKYPATLEGVQTIKIRPRIPGFIVSIPVNEGDRVQKGEVLFKLNAQEYKQQVTAAKAAVATAKNEVKRLTPLAEQGIISEYDLQAAKLKLQSAKAQLVQAKVNLSYTTIESPVDGVIGRIPYKVGSLVSSSIQQPLTTVSDISSIYAYFSMSERELLNMTLAAAEEGGNKTLSQLVKEMPPVRFEMANGKTYNKKGTLRLASGLINTQTGSASFRAEFPNPQQILRSGGTGNVVMPVPLDSVIVIPKSATYEIQKKRFVYTVTDSNTVKNTVIQTMPLSTKRLFVVKKGLSTGSTIITTGLQTLRNGAKIKPQPVNADSLYKALQTAN